MPLPHFGKHFNIVHPIKENAYDFTAISLKDDEMIRLLFPDRVRLSSNKDGDFISLRYSVTDRYLDKCSIMDIFKEVVIGVFTVYNEDGEVLHKEVMSVEFNSFDMDFYGDGKDLVYFNTSFRILSTELIDKDCELDRFKLIRDHKLSSII